MDGHQVGVPHVQGDAAAAVKSRPTHVTTRAPLGQPFDAPMAAPNVVALMPMKAHSARVPAKNWRELHGVPLYVHTLQALLASRSIERVYIDTDAVDLQDSLALHFRGHLDRITVWQPQPASHPAQI